MFNKLNTKWLVGIFAGLLLIVLLVTLNDKKATLNRNRSFRSQLTDFDSARVTSVVIYPKSQKDQIVLKKDGRSWSVQEGNKKYSADESAVKNAIENLISMTAIRMASRDKSSWKEFEVTDSSSTRVQVLTGKKVVADLFIGKFTYQQPKNANQYQYMRQRGTLTSYVRIAGDDAVYALDGLLSMTFNRQASDFRNRVIIKSEAKDWNKLSFAIPGGSFNLIKQNEKWMIDGILADSASVAKYLNGIQNLSSVNYIDQPALDKTEPDYTLSIEGANLQNPIKIKAFRTDTANMYALTSSMNEGSYFSGKQSGLFTKIFVDKNSFQTPSILKK